MNTKHIAEAAAILSPRAFLDAIVAAPFLRRKDEARVIALQNAFVAFTRALDLDAHNPRCPRDIATAFALFCEDDRQNNNWGHIRA